MSASVYQPTLGSNLTDADATVDPGSDEVSEYVLPAATLSANRILTLDTGGTPDFKFVVRIIRADLTGNTYTVKNDAGTTLYTFAASPSAPVGASFYFDGTHYAFLSTYDVSSSGAGGAFIAAGQAGGQTATGGTAASENLILSSTADSTKGKVIFGSTTGMQYSEVGSFLTIGIATPISNAIIHTKKSAANVAWYVQNTLTSGYEEMVFGESDSSFAAVAYITRYNSAFPTAGVRTAGTFEFGLDGGSGNMLYALYQASGSHIFTTTTSDTQRLKIANGGLITLGASSTALEFDPATNITKVGIASAASATFLHYKYDGASGANLYIQNPNAGAASYYGVTLGDTDALFGGQYFGFWQYGPSFTTAGNRTAGTAEFLLGGTSGANMLFNIGPATGDFIWGSNSVTEKMRLTNAGLLKVGNTGAMPANSIAQFNRDTNAANYLIVSNPNTGTAAEAGIILSQSATSYTNYLYVAQLSTGFTTNGPFIANSAAFEHTSGGSAHMFFSAYGTQDIDFYTTTSRTLRLKIATGGDVSLPSSNLLFSKAGDQNIDKSGSGDLLVIADNGGQSVRFVGNSGYSLVLGDTSVEMPSLGTPGGFVKAAPSSGALTSYALYTPKTGTALTNADQTIQPFTDKSSEYVQSAALTASRTKTLGTTTVVTGTLVRIVRTDGAAFTMLVVNGGGGAGTLFTFAASATEKQGATFYYNGTDWVLVGFEYLVS